MKSTKSHFYLLIFLISHILIKTQTAIESKCIRATNQFWKNQDLTPNTCTSITSSCCYIKVEYKLPNLGLISNKYCTVIYDNIQNFENGLISNIFMDIHRTTKKEMDHFYKNRLIGGNYNTTWYDNKEIWCPLDCTYPNSTTLQCDEFKEHELAQVSSDLLTELKSFYDKPNYNREKDCKDFDVENDNCKVTSDADSAYLSLENSLNFQYNITKCNYDSVFSMVNSQGGQCSVEVLNQTEANISYYIGNKNIDIIENFRPKSCFPLPNDLINVEVICPETFIKSQYTSLSIFCIILVTLLI